MSQRSVVQRSSAAVHNEVSKYNELFQESATADERKSAYKMLVANYYSLATDFYEYGWGRSFHFANRFSTETLAESLQRHESYLALKMKLKPGDKVLDIGCGVGGPLRRMAYLSGAHITGVTISAYQIQRAKAIGESGVHPFASRPPYLDPKQTENTEELCSCAFQVYPPIVNSSKAISCSCRSRRTPSIMST